MARAILKLRDGTIVTIEGTPDEVARLLELVSADGSATTPSLRPQRGASPVVRERSRTSRPRANGPVEYIRSLIADGFFADKRALGDVRTALEARGHIYPVTSLSPALVRLVRSGEVRRIKENAHWRYVNP